MITQSTRYMWYMQLSQKQINIAFFWDLTPCTLIDVIKFLGEEGGSRMLWNGGIYQTKRCHLKENNVNITWK